MRIYFTEKIIDLAAGAISVTVFGLFLGIILYIFEHQYTDVGTSISGGITLAFIIRILMFFNDNKSKDAPKIKK